MEAKLAQQKAEFEALKGKYDAFIQKALIVSSKHQEIISIFLDKYQISLEFINGLPKFALDEAAISKMPPAPGVPGFITKNCSDFFSVFQPISNTFNQFAQMVKENFTTKRVAMFFDFDSFIDSEIQKVNGIFENYKSLYEKLIKSNETINGLYNQLISAQKSSSKPKQGRSPKKSQDIESKFRHYAIQLTLQSSLVRRINNEHSRHLITISKSMVTIKQMENEKRAFLLNIFLMFCDICKGVKIQIPDTFKVHFSDSWKNSFVEFVKREGIVRTDISQSYFKPYKFSFQEHKLTKAFKRPRLLPKSAPCYFAVAIHNFKGENQSELSLEKGEYIYLYEYQHESGFCWFLAKNKKNQLGFVPSNAIRPIHCQYAIMINPQLKCKDNYLGVPATSIVNVKDINDKTITCKDLNQDSGDVFIDSIILDITQ